MAAGTATPHGAVPSGAQPREIDAALDALRAVFKAISLRAADEWLALDLSVAQIKAVIWLASAPESTVGHLADALHIGKPAASILVDRLVQLGYVTRTEDPADRRRTLTRLSPTGEALVSRLRAGGPERMRGMVGAWLGALDPNDVRALARGLEALARVAAGDPAYPTSGEPADGAR